MGRSPCCSREGLNRGAWTVQEDMILSEYIRNGNHEDRGWRNISKKAGLNRCEKSCRSRWFYYLRPDIKRGNIKPDEEELIIRMHRLLGNRWSLIAGRLPGRTDNEIKNYWNTHLKKKQKLLTDECQQKTQNLKTRPESRPPLQNGVFKTTPVKITAVRQYQMVTANSGSNNGGFKMCTIQETKNFSKTLCDLFVDDAIREDDSESVAFRRPDADLVEPEAMLQQSLFSDHFAGLGLEDFYSSGPVTSSDVETNGFDHESNMQQVNSITLPDDQRLKEFYDSTEPVDWNHVLDYIVNSTIAVKNP